VPNARRREPGGGLNWIDEAVDGASDTRLVAVETSDGERGVGNNREVGGLVVSWDVVRDDEVDLKDSYVVSPDGDTTGGRTD
jgi:hypothetical protein